MGLSGISKSQVSKLCKEVDERVHAFLDRPLAGEWPYLWLDATYLKQREGGRIVSVAAIIAVAVNTNGRRGRIEDKGCDRQVIGTPGLTCEGRHHRGILEHLLQGVLPCVSKARSL